MKRSSLAPPVLVLLVVLFSAIIGPTNAPPAIAAQTVRSWSGSHPWLPGEQAARDAVAAQTRGVLNPLLWPGTLPTVLTGVRLLTPAQSPMKPGTSGTFLVEYRSADGRVTVQFGASPSIPPRNARVQPWDVRNLPAQRLQGTGAMAGQVWLWWREPGRWRPAGAGGAARPYVAYALHATGLTMSEAEGIVEGLAPLDSAWAYVRGRLPKSVTILPPAWLPTRFRATPPAQTVMDVPSLGGPYYQVGYRSNRGDVLIFALGAINTGSPDTQERIRVRGVQGTLTTSSNWPPIGVYWREHGQFYAIQAHGVTRAEMLHIVAGLAPVAPAP